MFMMYCLSVSAPAVLICSTPGVTLDRTLPSFHRLEKREKRDEGFLWRRREDCGYYTCRQAIEDFFVAAKALPS